MLKRLLTAGCAAAVFAAVPSSTWARDTIVKSFDGTPIITHFFAAPGLKPGERQPTVLYGPGWAGAGQTDTTEASTIDQVGLARLLKSGYNVVTWDPRGFGGSGGEAHVDNPGYEARDVSKIIDFIARQPEALLDKPGDPRLGMVGGSYGGGIQWVTAGTDPRVDVMVPNSSWNSLETSLFPDGDFKMGIVSLLYALGVEGGINGGLTSPAGPQTGSLDPHIQSFYDDGMTTGTVSPDNAAWFRSSGPWNVVHNVRIPTFIAQGTVDILFTLSEAIRNYRALTANGAPVKMTWYCGGHGQCLDNAGTDTDRVPRETLAWLARYLRGDKTVDTGPGFEWISQDGAWHTAPTYLPPPAEKSLAASGSGTLILHPSPGSGAAEFASSSPEGVDLAIPTTTGAHTDIVGEPKLHLTYSGTAVPASTWAYAQIIDTANGHALGNQATPIPLTLDGNPHTIDRALNAIAYSATPASRLQLQVIPATSLYREQTSTGVVTLQHVDITMPAVGMPPAATNVSARTRLALSLIGQVRAGQRQMRVRVRAVGQALRRIQIDVRTHGRLAGRITARSLGAGRSRVLTVRLRSPARSGTYTLTAVARDPSNTVVRARRTIRPRAA